VTAQHLPKSDINESLTIIAQIRWRCFRVHSVTAGHDRQAAPYVVPGKLWEAARQVSLTWCRVSGLSLLYRFCVKTTMIMAAQGIFWGIC
jgi:hypothetical protein